MAVQTSFPTDMSIGFPGQISSGNSNIYSGASLETVQFGKAVCFGDSEGKTAKRPVANQVIFSANLITANVVDGTVVVDGTETDLTSTTFATDHATTMGAVATKITEITGIASATVSDKTITIVASDGKIAYLKDFAVTAGATQATVSYSCSESIIGASVHEMREPDSSGNVQYAQYDALNYLRKGRMYVTVEEAVDVTDSVYVRFIEGSSANQQRGTFRKSAGGVAVQLSSARYLSKASAGEIAEVEINLP